MRTYIYGYLYNIIQFSLMVTTTAGRNEHELENNYTTT